MGRRTEVNRFGGHEFEHLDRVHSRSTLGSETDVLCNVVLIERYSNRKRKPKNSSGSAWEERTGFNEWLRNREETHRQHDLLRRIPGL